jgi:glyoxylase-like metal-dependent hydrolase (beta-lactamase superfamily II)
LLIDKIFKISLQNTPAQAEPSVINVYFINEPPRTLIDTGIKSEPSIDALRNGLKAYGLDLTAIERILVTHGHIDHYGLAKRLSSFSSAPIYVHREEQGGLQRIINSLDFRRYVFLRNGGPETMVDAIEKLAIFAMGFADNLEDVRFLEEGEVIPFESTMLKVIHTPGHTPGHLCFFLQKEKILFSGDHLIKNEVPFPDMHVVGSSPPFHYMGLKEYLASLEKIEKLDISTAFPGHGEEIYDVKKLIVGIFDYYQNLINRVSLSLSERKTPFEIVRELFPDASLLFKIFGLYKILGILEILKEKGMVEWEEKGEKDYYFSRGK